MSCSTPLGYAVSLLIAVVVAFWLGRRWERFAPEAKEPPTSGVPR